VGKVLAFVFIVVPFVEIFLIITLGKIIGFWGTVAMMIGTGVLGAWLVKREGLRMMRKYSEAIARGRMPDEGVMSGVLVLIGGALLIAPGVITDVVGLLLLFPLTRKLAARPLERWARRKLASATLHVHVDTHDDQAVPRRGRIIDV